MMWRADGQMHKPEKLISYECGEEEEDLLNCALILCVPSFGSQANLLWFEISL